MKKLKKVSLLIIVAVMFFLFTGFSTTKETVINSYSYSVNDVINLQKFLLGKPTESSIESKPYDQNSDKKWNVLDLCLIKNKILISNNQQSDTLVVYFSRTGNTQKISEYLIELTNADSYMIEATIPYTDDDINYIDTSCRANQEQGDKTIRPEILQPLESIDNYDTIFLGYPIWWGEEPRIIDTFLESYDFSDKTVIPFCTSASSGISISEQNISELVSIGNQLDGRRFTGSTTKDTLEDWLKSLDITTPKTDEKLYLTINGITLTATLEDNSSVQALKERLSEDDVIINAHDYGNFEKVGSLGFSLPTNDTQITTQPGDLILYQGNKFTLYYDVNAWNFTKLGHIDNLTQDELKALLGDGDVTITLSLK